MVIGNGVRRMMAKKKKKIEIGDHFTGTTQDVAVRDSTIRENKQEEEAKARAVEIEQNSPRVAKDGVKFGDKTYPTKNLDFVPNPKATEQIVFKADGSVDVSPIGIDKPINLSKEEYNTSLGKSGNITNKVQELEKTRALTPELKQKQMLSSEMTDIPNIEQLGEDTGNLKDIRGTPVAKGLNKLAELFDSVSSNVPGLPKFKEPKKIANIKQNFNSMSDVIDEDIKLYQAGLITATEVNRDIETALGFTIQLYATTKGKGQANLDYWLDEGASIEVEVSKQLKELENQRILLGL